MSIKNSQGNFFRPEFSNSAKKLDPVLSITQHLVKLQSQASKKTLFFNDQYTFSFIVEN